MITAAAGLRVPAALLLGGRILRPYPGKETAEVHDYHDIGTGVLAAILAGRAPGYASLGFPDPRRIIPPSAPSPASRRWGRAWPGRIQCVAPDERYVGQHRATTSVRMALIWEQEAAGSKSRYLDWSHIFFESIVILSLRWWQGGPPVPFSFLTTSSCRRGGQ